MANKKVFHEFNSLQELPYIEDGSTATIPEYNDALFRLYLEISKFNGGKVVSVIAGPGVAEMIVLMPSGQKELKDEEFYKMGYHGTLPIFVDKSLGKGDILVVCKYGTEKIRVKGF